MFSCCHWTEVVIKRRFLSAQQSSHFLNIMEHKLRLSAGLIRREYMCTLVFHHSPWLRGWTTWLILVRTAVLSILFYFLKIRKEEKHDKRWIFLLFLKVTVAVYNLSQQQPPQEGEQRIFSSPDYWFLNLCNQLLCDASDNKTISINAFVSSHCSSFLAWWWARKRQA